MGWSEARNVMSPALALGCAWEWYILSLSVMYFFETFDCYGYSSVVMPLMKCNSKGE